MFILWLYTISKLDITPTLLSYILYKSLLSFRRYLAQIPDSDNISIYRLVLFLSPSK